MTINESTVVVGRRRQIESLSNAFTILSTWQKDNDNGNDDEDDVNINEMN